MANRKISAFTDGTTAEADDRIPVARDPSGTPLSRYITPAYINTYISGVAQTITAGRSFQSNAVFASASGGFVVDPSDTLALGGGDGTCHIHTASAGIIAANTEADDLVVESGGTTGISILSSTGGNGNIFFSDDVDNDVGFIQYSHSGDVMIFGVNTSEGARISSTRFFKASNVGTYLGSTAAYHELRNGNNSSGDIAVIVSNGGSNTENTSSYMMIGHSGVSQLFYIYGNGNVANSNNSYGAISDRKFKEEIIDSASQWDDIKKMKVKKYKNKKQHNQWNIGLVADEVKAVSPGCVFTAEVDGEAADGVNYSVVYMKALKALQEAMDRIEALEAKLNQ